MDSMHQRTRLLGSMYQREIRMSGLFLMPILFFVFLSANANAEKQLTVEYNKKLVAKKIDHLTTSVSDYLSIEKKFLKGDIPIDAEPDPSDEMFRLASIIAQDLNWLDVRKDKLAREQVAKIAEIRSRLQKSQWSYRRPQHSSVPKVKENLRLGTIEELQVFTRGNSKQFVGVDLNP